MSRPRNSEIRRFRVKRLADPAADASHLRGPCLDHHEVTLENTVRIGRAGYRCRLCRRRAANRWLQRSRAGSSDSIQA